MASLFLLLSELLKHKNTDYLTSSSAANGCALVAAKGVASFPNKSSNLNADLKFEQLPRICVDFVWP
ncbi:unnamed protein product [Withania somnifera]